MNLLGIALLTQLAAPARQAPPVLAFPEPGLDDSVAYQGYQTRFFRDAAGNTVQIYLDRRSGRIVHLWADAEDESAAFTARDASGHPASIRWADADAETFRAGRARVLEYHLVAEAPRIHFGWFLLGSMRVERDFQYAGRHRAPFDSPPFAPPEMDRLLAALTRLAPAERRRHLAFLNSPDVRTVRGRLHPTVSIHSSASSWVARVGQPSLDGRDTLTLELRTEPSRVIARRTGDSLTLRSRGAGQIPFTVRITTTAPALTPLARDEIFSAEFLRFLGDARSAAERGAPDSVRLRARWMERQVRGVELLSSREKLMAGLPAYATYFGRDMLLSALMMRPIWRDEMSEFVIASVLRKLSPNGDVSHEEALGGQAVREAASEYARLVDESLRAAHAGIGAQAERRLGEARDVLRHHRRVRENYHMIDDEFQLPVLAARWLGDPRVPASRKRAFLADSSDGGGTRLARLLRELGLVARLTGPYAADPIATNLVSFPARDSAQWSSASWRDSNEGYAGGRFAMDVNAIWVPHALESLASIFETLRALDLSGDSLYKVVPQLAANSPLGRYARDSLALRSAIDRWRGASRHFLVTLGPAEVRSRVAARLAALPGNERSYWERVLLASMADQDSLVFLALSLDTQGRPIGVANSDPAARLFLDDSESGPSDSASAESVMRDARLFTRPFPVGLLVDRVGPVVTNDAYAPPALWPQFERDRYHGPRVVWGREVNLFLLGVANRISGAASNPALAPYVPELRTALTQVLAAVEASGFRSELWSYVIENGRVVPVRYGTGSDVQLWSTTDLAVQFALSRLSDGKR